MSKSLKLFLGISYILILFFFLYLIFSYVELDRLDDFLYYKELQIFLEKMIGDNLYLNLFIFSLFCLVWVSLLVITLCNGVIFKEYIYNYSISNMLCEL